MAASLAKRTFGRNSRNYGLNMVKNDSTCNSYVLKKIMSVKCILYEQLTCINTIGRTW